jgi:hypothetical protein
VSVEVSQVAERTNTMCGMNGNNQDGVSTTGSSASTPGEANAVLSAGERTANADSDDEKAKTLGVLLVHGIGSQRRGDSLVQCVTVLHSWLHD